MTALPEARDAWLKELAKWHLGSSGLRIFAQTYLAALEAPPAEQPPVTVSERSTNSAIASLNRELAIENERLKKDCEIFITSNGAMTEELLALRAQLDRLKNPSETTFAQMARAGLAAFEEAPGSFSESELWGDISCAVYNALIAGAEDAKS